MYLWIAVGLCAIMLAKFLTSKWSAALNIRLDKARRDFDKAKAKLKAAQKDSGVAKTMEALELERIRHMKELMQDIQIRLTQKEGREGREDRVHNAIDAAVSGSDRVLV